MNIGQSDFFQHFISLLNFVSIFNFEVEKIYLKIIFYCTLGIVLLFLSFYDIKFGLILDKLLFIISILCLFILKIENILVYLGNFLFLFLIAFSLKIGYLVLKKKDGLGWGDVKFLALCGLYLKFKLIPLFLCLTGIFGVLTGIIWQYNQWGDRFPLGPSIAGALWLIVVFTGIL